MKFRQTVGPIIDSLGLRSVARSVYVESRMLGERIKFMLEGRPSADSAIVITSSGRSGSTWFGDVLAHSGRLQQIYEPLFPLRNPTVCRLTGWEPIVHRTRANYLRPGDQDPEWREHLHRILTGQERNTWTDFRRDSYWPDRFLIKFIRANLMIGFIYEQFQPAIIHLVRHPCAVLNSRLKTQWQADVEDILGQEALVEDYLRPWVGKIEKERDRAGSHAVWWAVENMVARDQLSKHPHLRVHYEHLVQSPHEELNKVCTWLHLDGKRISDSEINEPSRQSRLKRPLSAVERLEAWQRQLPQEEQARALYWAHELGIDWYDESVLPRAPSNLHELG